MKWHRIFMDGGVEEDKGVRPRPGLYGGRGHTEQCKKKGPVKKATRSRGFFQEASIFDRCEECGQEIFDLPLQKVN